MRINLLFAFLALLRFLWLLRIPSLPWPPLLGKGIVDLLPELRENLCFLFDLRLALFVNKCFRNTAWGRLGAKICSSSDVTTYFLLALFRILEGALTNFDVNRALVVSFGAGVVGSGFGFLFAIRCSCFLKIHARSWWSLAGDDYTLLVGSKLSDILGDRSFLGVVKFLKFLLKIRTYRCSVLILDLNLNFWHFWILIWTICTL